MKHTAIELIVITFFATILNAQPQIDLLRMYDLGGDRSDQFFDIYGTVDGDYLVCGTDRVLAIDGEGNIVWEYADQGSSFYSIIEADNGDAVVAGKLNGSMCGAIRLDAEGEVVWREMYVAGSASAIIELKSDNFLLCGREQRGRDFGYAVMINSEGEIIWDHIYGDGNADNSYLKAMRETEDGVVAAGYQVMHQRQGWAIKLDHEDEGNQIWAHDYADEEYSLYFESIVSTRFGFAIGGRVYTGAPDSPRMGLYFINGDGDQIGRSLYENRFRPFLYCINKLSDGGYVLVGSTGRDDDNNNRQYPTALRTDSEGTVLWSSDFSEYIDQQPEPGYRFQFLNSLRGVVVLPNDVIVACGTMYNSDERGNGQDGVIVRLEPDQFEPVIFYWSPEDTLFSVFPGDTTEFIVRARDQQGDELSYEWLSADTSMGEDTTVTVVWDELGEHIIQCQVSDGENISAVNWRVEVAELYIDTYSPDSLNLIVRPNTTIDFTVTSQAIEGDPVEYAWLLDDEQIGDEDSLSITFEEVGDYEVIAVAFREEQSDSIAWFVEVKEMYIDGYSPDSLNLTIQRNRQVEFSVSVDAFEIDSVEYQWLLDDEEIDSVFNDTLLITFENSGEYQLKAIAFTGDERDSVEWQVTVVNMIVDYIPREFDLTVPIDTVMEFSIEPFDPEDPSLNILWTVDDDSVDNRSWTFIDFDTAGEYQVNVYVSDSSSADSMSWNIMVSPNDVGQDDLTFMPSEPILYPPSPNPFNSQTSVRYALPVAGQVRLELFDVSGRLVSELVSEHQNSGWYDVSINCDQFATGVYFVTMVAEQSVQAQKLLLIK